MAESPQLPASQRWRLGDPTWMVMVVVTGSAATCGMEQWTHLAAKEAKAAEEAEAEAARARERAYVHVWTEICQYLLETEALKSGTKEAV